MTKCANDFELYSSMTLRPTAVAAATSILLCALLALLLQLGLLGALGWGLGSTPPTLPLDPAANVRPLTVSDTKGLRFEPTRSAAVAQASNLLLPADNALGLILHTEDVVGNLGLTFGWLSTQDVRRSVSATARIAANPDPQRSVLLLSGHPQWRERVTRVALAFERRDAGTAAANAPAGAFLARAEWLPATPLGGLRLLSAAWFGGSNIITPNEAVGRLLPLALWLALIAAGSLLLVALVFRKQPVKRAEALRLTLIWVAAITVLLTLFTSIWPGWTAPLGAGVAAALALVLVDRSITLSSWPVSAAQRAGLAALAAGVAWVLAPLVALVAILPAAVLWLGQSSLVRSSRLPASTMRIGALFTALPMLLLAAMGQGMIPSPPLLTPLVDPTSTLAAVTVAAGGLPGLALGALISHQLWPANVSRPRWSSSAVAALMWALTGAVAVLAVPRIAALAGGSSTYIAVFFPALACLSLALLPKFQSIAKTVEETVAVEAKTELDLSAQALTLLQSHGERVQAALLRGELGAAHSALVQMQRIASAARATTLARLRVALGDGNLNLAQTAAAELETHTPLESGEADALLDAAHRSNQPARVIALYAAASRNEFNTRMLAHAQLVTQGPAQALQTLAAWPDEHVFAREIGELHLLSDDVPATQQALVNSGIPLDDPLGQAYIGRLRMRAEGYQMHGQTVSTMATYNPQLGAAQAAMGELLEYNRNMSGARARYLLAMKLDAGLWPLQHRVSRLEAQLQAAAERAAASAQTTATSAA
jgi:hypothetical protein